MRRPWMIALVALHAVGCQSDHAPAEPLDGALEQDASKRDASDDFEVSGVVTLEVQTTWLGNVFLAPAYFFATMQLSIGHDEVLAPQGVEWTALDECKRDPQPYAGYRFAPHVVWPDTAVVIDLDESETLELSPEVSGLHEDPQLAVELSATGLQPRFGGRYAFQALGGELHDAHVYKEVALPDALEFPALEHADHFAFDDGMLRWNGTSELPMWIDFEIIADVRSTASEHVICRFEDDGEQALPELLMEALSGRGLVRVQAERGRPEPLRSPEPTLAAHAIVKTSYLLAYGETCDRQDIVEACAAAHEQLRVQYEACGAELEEWDPCPSYEALLCDECASRFACIGANVVCGPQGFLVQNDSCLCP